MSQGSAWPLTRHQAREALDIDNLAVGRTNVQHTTRRQEPRRDVARRHRLLENVDHDDNGEII
jgi:hypothetical protein